MPRNPELSEKMRAESREKILTSATRVFTRKGYYNCRVSDIAREAGMSQGNIYWYFPGKDSILKAVLMDGFQAVNTVLEEALGGDAKGVSRLEGLVEALVNLYRSKGEVFAVSISILAHGGAGALAALGLDTHDIGVGYHQRLRAVLERARDEGAIRPDAADPDVLSGLFFSLFNGLVLTYGPAWADILPTGEISRAALDLLGVKSR